MKQLSLFPKTKTRPNANAHKKPRTYAARVDQAIDTILGQPQVRETAWEKAAELKELRRSGIRA